MRAARVFAVVSVWETRESAIDSFEETQISKNN